MEGGGDFLKRLGIDMSIEIFMHLDDPSDLVRVALVSSSWRWFVIANALSKQLFLKLFPEMASAAHAIEGNNMIEVVLSTSNASMEWMCLERNHMVYSFLAKGLTPSLREDCILSAYSASSTDNYPEESVQNTLEPNDRVGRRASYWSSKGESDPAVPETLVYKLRSNLCVITEIHLQVFQAYFQYGFPIYSAKAVRFHMGHPKFPLESEGDFMDEPVDDHEYHEHGFTWTYTSPEFPMVQDNCLQKFKLPEPVLCIGGILQVELLGRVQRQEMDGLYYICIAHVQVVGRLLSSSFDAKVLYPSGKCLLKYQSGEACSTCPMSSEAEGSGPSRFSSFTTRTARLMQQGVRGWEQVFLTAFLGSGMIQEEESDDEYFA